MKVEGRLMVGHVAPEAAAGGPIAIVQDGYEITVFAGDRRIELYVSSDEFT